MTRIDDVERRTVLRGAGVLVAGVLAGCSGGSGDGESGSGGTTGAGATTGTGASTEPETGGSAGESTTDGGETGSASGSSAAVEEYLADANGYDGSLADMTGNDTVEIAVGAGAESFAFGPAAVRVASGTTVRWTWTGEGGAHNVISEDGPLDSGEAESGSDVTYEETLETAGTYRYYCEPHRRLGMKGVVVVEDDAGGGSSEGSTSAGSESETVVATAGASTDGGTAVDETGTEQGT